MLIIGLTGTNGAGKGEVAKYLKEEKGFLHFSVRDVILAEIRRQKLAEDRETMTQMANDLRRRHGPAYLAETLFASARASKTDAVIESLRNPHEILALRKLGRFYSVAVDANPRIRFERIKARKSSTDDATFQRFMEQEQREAQSNDPYEQNINGCVVMAQHLIVNDGTLEKLHSQIEEVLQEGRR